MVLVGCDLGALCTKVVAMRGEELLAASLVHNQGNLGRGAQDALDRVLQKAGLAMEQVEACCGTGWGQQYIPFVHQPASMINCLARGALWSVPGARTVIDVGGLGTTVISINERGKVSEYRTNDRCASGTGFYLDLAAQALELSVEEMGLVALDAADRAHISGQCAVFGESEIVTHINDGTGVPEIAAGVAYSIGSGVATTVKRLGTEPPMVLSGGVSKSPAVVKAIQEKLGVAASPFEQDPQMLGAVGAALSVGENLQRGGPGK